MEVTELIEQMRQANPNLLEGIPADKAEALLKSVFRHINEKLARTEEGVVKYAGLGRFRVKKIEREVEGKKASRTRISFRLREPGEKTGGARIRRDGAAGEARKRPGARKRDKGRGRRRGKDGA